MVMAKGLRNTIVSIYQSAKDKAKCLSYFWY